MSTSTADIKKITLLTAGTATSTYVILHLLTAFVKPFDSSHTIAGTSEPGLRWDALHFQAVATRGYQYEQQLAFQPGWHGLLYLLRNLGSGLRGTEENVLTGLLRASFLMSLTSRVIANAFLYRISRRLYDRKIAIVSCILYSLPPAPAIMVVPYTESLFAALSFAAIHYSLNHDFMLASVLLACATSLRPTGMIGCIILALHIVFPNVPMPSTIGQTIAYYSRRLLLAAACCALVVAPFLTFQLYSYHAFCSGSVTRESRPWCGLPLPLSYAWVQREYWNVGPFRYWTIEQLPNFALATPVIALSAYGCFDYLKEQDISLRSLRKPELPIFLYQSAMLLLLLFASHTQIALRLSMTDPLLWSTVARLLLPSSPKSTSSEAMGRKWIWWCLLWASVSVVLWAGHYPPA